jgi:shikimate dehydrogenase
MKVFCVMSDERVFQSKSPAMHTRVLQRLGIDGVYVPFKVRADGLSDAVSGLKALHVAGANVTVPFKKAAMPYVDTLDTEATAIGALNTIVREGDRLVGYNTDARGFGDSLKDIGFSPSGKSGVVVGTGGAARAVVLALRRLDLACITVVGRSLSRAEELARAFGCNAGGLDSLGNPHVPAQILVNATSVSSPAEAPEVAELVRGLNGNGCELVVDINYGRKDNIWEQTATALGARFMDGLPMLAYQAQRSFALWTGLHVPPEYFLEALEEIS